MATYAGIDNFESYSVAALTGNNGGSGFSGAWSGSSNFTVVSSPVNTGTRAVGNTSHAVSSIDRPFTTAGDGILYFSIQASTAALSGDSAGVILRNSGVSIIAISLIVNAGQIAFFNGASWQNIQAFSANTWYRIGVQWDGTNHADTARFNVDGGAFTAYTGVSASFTTLDTIRLQYGTTQTVSMYWDDISNVYAPAATANPAFLLKMI